MHSLYNRSYLFGFWWDFIILLYFFLRLSSILVSHSFSLSLFLSPFLCRSQSGRLPDIDWNIVSKGHQLQNRLNESVSRSVLLYLVLFSAKLWMTRPDFAIVVCASLSVQFNSLNDVPQVAQRYVTIVARTWRRVSVQSYPHHYLYTYVRYSKSVDIDSYTQSSGTVILRKGHLHYSSAENR